MWRPVASHNAKDKARHYGGLGFLAGAHRLNLSDPDRVTWPEGRLVGQLGSEGPFGIRVQCEL